VPLVLAALINIPPNVGYPLVFLLVAIETMGIPVPGETALITGALAASSGQLSIEVVVALAAVAAIVGDNIGFLIGRKFGRRVFEKPGPGYDQRLALLEIGEPFFERHGPKAVFLARWIALVRFAAAWLAGINRMRFRQFFFWNALGGISWGVTYGLVGYFAGEAGAGVLRQLGIIGAIVLGVMLVATIVLVIVRERRRAARHGSEQHASRGASTQDEPGSS
jgi:membrane protein DedA with SNARE-associated domain